MLNCSDIVVRVYFAEGGKPEYPEKNVGHFDKNTLYHLVDLVLNTAQYLNDSVLNTVPYLIDSWSIRHKLNVMQAISFLYHGGLDKLVIRPLYRARQLKVLIGTV